MSRLEKKCLVASAGTHGFLLLVLLLGSAFFVSKDKPASYPRIKVIPSKLIESALAGGGGNPKIAPSDDQQKGSPTAPPQPAPTPPKPAAPPKPIEPLKADPKKVEPKPDLKKVEARPVTPKNDPVKTPRDSAKETAKPVPDPKKTPLELTPIVRNDTERTKAKAEAEAREAQERAAAEKRLAKQLGNLREQLQRGFSQGTKVEVGGPGGEAYANYAQLVQAMYDDAWVVLPDIANDDAVAFVKVTIARDGTVVRAFISKRSGNSPLDKSVQRALDKVKFVAPFPEGSHESERTFTIEFNLKAKRLTG